MYPIDVFLWNNLFVSEVDSSMRPAPLWSGNISEEETSEMRMEVRTSSDSVSNLFDNELSQPVFREKLFIKNLRTYKKLC